MSDPVQGRPVSVMVVDDHPLFLCGVASLLQREPGIELVATACSDVQAIGQHRALRPDVTIMDARSRDVDGIAATAAIVRELPLARVILLSKFEGDYMMAHAAAAGAWAYLPKHSEPCTLLDAIRRVNAGSRVFCGSPKRCEALHLSPGQVTMREAEVLRLIADGASNERVARSLAISEHTVKAHLRKLMPKLGARDRTHAVVVAIRQGII